MIRRKTAKGDTDPQYLIKLTDVKCFRRPISRVRSATCVTPCVSDLRFSSRANHAQSLKKGNRETDRCADRSLCDIEINENSCPVHTTAPDHNLSTPRARHPPFGQARCTEFVSFNV